MEDNVFRSDDFLKGKNESKLDKKKLFENLEEENELPDSVEPSIISSEDSDEVKDLIDTKSKGEDFYNKFKQENPHAMSKQDMDELFASHDDEDFINTDDIPNDTEEEIENEISIKESNSNYYKLYSDKSENFVCDISIEGANPKETEARIVVESDDWTLMFNGEVKNGKCIVPIKKLNILKEGQVGNIRLEVIAEGNLFVPWEDKFKVKVSKKVTVRVNEQKDYYKSSPKKHSNVKVNVRK